MHRAGSQKFPSLMPLALLLLLFLEWCTVKSVDQIELNALAIINSCTIGQVHLLVTYKAEIIIYLTMCMINHYQLQ